MFGNSFLVGWCVNVLFVCRCAHDYVLLVVLNHYGLEVTAPIDRGLNSYNSKSPGKWSVQAYSTRLSRDGESATLEKEERVGVLGLVKQRNTCMAQSLSCPQHVCVIPWSSLPFCDLVLVVCCFLVLFKFQIKSFLHAKNLGGFSSIEECYEAKHLLKSMHIKTNIND